MKVFTMIPSHVTLHPTKSTDSCDIPITKSQENLSNEVVPSKKLSFEKILGNDTSQSDYYGGCNFEELFKVLKPEMDHQQTLHLDSFRNVNSGVTFSDDINEVSRDNADKIIDSLNLSSIGQSSSQFENTEQFDIDKNLEGKTPFGTGVEEAVNYVSPEDSILPRTKRVSFADGVLKDKVEHEGASDPSTSFSLLNNSHFENVASNEVRVNESQDDTTEIKHENKEVEEILRRLGRESLLKVSSPAKCSRVNNSPSRDDSGSSLPLCPSLYSLPLDAEDLNYIAKEAGKTIPIRMKSEDAIPVVEYEWENTDATGKSSTDTKWNRAFAGSGIHCERNLCKREPFEIKWKIVNKKGQDFCSVLPTITEEEDEVVGEISNYTNNTPSEKTKSIRKSSKFKTKSTELRYCLVEFDKKNVVIGETCNILKNKNKLSCRPESNDNELGEYNVITEQSNKSNTQIGYWGDSNNEIGCVLKNSTSSVTCSPLTLALEEMIMLSTIYLTQT